jgi:hypothetical protein
MVTAMELPKQAIVSLGLEKLTLISLEEANSSGLIPVDIDIAILDYTATSRKSDHYLLRDAPYSVVRGEVGLSHPSLKMMLVSD